MLVQRFFSFSINIWFSSSALFPIFLSWQQKDGKVLTIGGFIFASLLILGGHNYDDNDDDYDGDDSYGDNCEVYDDDDDDDDEELLVGY